MTITTGAGPDMFAADSSLGSSRAFEALFMSSTVAIVAIDRDGSVLMWNRGAERMLGWTEDEVVGRTLPVIAPEDRELFASVRARVMEGQEIDGMVVSHVRSDGSRVDLELSLRALCDEAREPRAILGVASEPSGRSEAGELADRLVLEVVDDGPSVDQGTSRERRSRLGLAYVRERLESHHGSEASIEVRSRRQGGVSARVGLPLRPGAMRPSGREEKGGVVEEDAPDGTDGFQTVRHST